LRPARTHRKTVLDALPPEQRPVAEQVLQGGMPAVRQAIEKQNSELGAEGKPLIKAGPLLAMAEDLLPRLRTAEWRDRAEAAMADVDELDLRDLRSVVVAADNAARDDETRELAASLRAALARRVDEEQRTWLHEITSALDEGRVVRALRLSSRPPKAGSIFPRDVATRLAEATGAALSADASADRWGAVLEALAFAPVRRSVTPASIPERPSAELTATIERFAGRLPDLAAAFGIEPRPEPAPRPRRKPSRPKPTAPAEPVASSPSATETPVEPAAEAPVESTELVEPVESTEPAEAVESTEPVEAMESIEAVEPVEAMESIEAVEPAEAMQPVESGDPVIADEAVLADDAAAADPAAATG
jgi:hypothetical protein